MPVLEKCASLLPRFNFLLVIALLLAAWPSLANSAWAQNAKPAAAAKSTKDGLIARGKYIVEGVSVCGQCHTPRNSDGTYDLTKQLEGAPVWMRPADPSENWPLQAPRLAGTPPASDADMVKLLTTGIWQNGTYLRPPMPQFRMTQQDAEAVVAFLRSLRPSAQ